jgi:hypothetical protein
MDHGSGRARKHLQAVPRLRRVVVQRNTVIPIKWSTFQFAKFTLGLSLEALLYLVLLLVSQLFNLFPKLLQSNNVDLLLGF